MLFPSLILAFLALRKVFASPIPDTLAASVSAGFQNPKLSYSQGRHAICVSANVPVSFTATTTKLLLASPANQTMVTEIFQEILQTDSKIATKIHGGAVTTNGTYGIDITYCVPVEDDCATAVQILTHGIGADKSYWDIAPGYSYVDAAADAGYATLAYNRLGVGESDHPDPLQIVQATVDVEIQHGLTKLLREGSINRRKFESVIGVGHSYGSIIQLAQNAKYPTDVDAVVLTGFVNNVVSLPYTIASNNPAVAAINNPKLWGSLPYGYVVHDSAISIQQPFFRHPHFPANTFTLSVAHKQTYTIGQEFTLPVIYSAAPLFTGPVDVVVGQHDFPFCQGECAYPVDQAAATIPALYPAAGAGSESVIIPDSGHFLNAHYAARAQFSQINAFLEKNGF